ncbi:hypothetical protein SKAU_G00136550 [Synaphobranchus kaupii]|uniref:Uncharacterized protein n=1 Tax=Synaphobranchus kaupii TaxID=118154 RepID=A0A9Q1FRQ0_SYNKA|nr:hypothetical protein SKAU_G00136550 [Synaphobranchus kaupii]
MKEFFQNRAENVKRQCFDSGRAFKGNRAALKVPYLVSLNIAKAKKPHSIGEQLIKPCLKDVCLALLGEEEQIGVPLCAAVKKDIAEHMSGLQQNFQRFFPDPQGSQKLQWVRYPFQAVPSADLGLSQPELEALGVLTDPGSHHAWFQLYLHLSS